MYHPIIMLLVVVTFIYVSRRRWIENLRRRLEEWCTWSEEFGKEG
jgi:hypothetical protein